MTTGKTIALTNGKIGGFFLDAFSLPAVNGYIYRFTSDLHFQREIITITMETNRTQRLTFPRPKKQRVWSLIQEDTLEWETATHSSILVWKIPWTEESGRFWQRGRKATEQQQPLNLQWKLLFKSHLLTYLRTSVPQSKLSVASCEPKCQQCNHRAGNHIGGSAQD